jgi:hypothetical protein
MIVTFTVVFAGVELLYHSSLAITVTFHDVTYVRLVVFTDKVQFAVSFKPGNQVVFNIGDYQPFIDVVLVVPFAYFSGEKTVAKFLGTSSAIE